MAEAIVFLEAHGVSPALALKVLQGGLAGSAVLDRKGAGMVARDFKPGFRLELHHKDMGIVADAAREAGVAIPLGSLAAQLVAAANARGDGGLDHSALLRLVLDLSGRGEAAAAHASAVRAREVPASGDQTPGNPLAKVGQDDGQIYTPPDAPSRDPRQ